MTPSLTKLVPASEPGWAKPSQGNAILSDCWSSTPGSGSHQDPRRGQQHCSRQGKVFASEAAGLWPSVRCITRDETSQGLSGMEVPVNSHVPAPVNLLNIYLHSFVISRQPNTILPCPAHSTSKYWTLTQPMIWDRINVSIFVVFQCILYAPKLIYRHWNTGKTLLISSLHIFAVLNITAY